MVRRAPKKSFTVRLEADDYDALVALGQRQKPTLNLQYLVNYAIQKLLRDTADPQLALRLGDPLLGNSSNAATPGGDREP